MQQTESCTLSVFSRSDDCVLFSRSPSSSYLVAPILNQPQSLQVASSSSRCPPPIHLPPLASCYHLSLARPLLLSPRCTAHASQVTTARPAHHKLPQHGPRGASRRCTAHAAARPMHSKLPQLHIPHIASHRRTAPTQSKLQQLSPRIASPAARLAHRSTARASQVAAAHPTHREADTSPTVLSAHRKRQQHSQLIASRHRTARASQVAEACPVHPHCRPHVTC